MAIWNSVLLVGRQLLSLLDWTVSSQQIGFRFALVQWLVRETGSADRV